MQTARKGQPGPRQLELLGYLERRGGRAHGLVHTGRAIGPNGSGHFGVRAIRRAEARGLVRVEPCTHGIPQALDVVLDAPEVREREARKREVEREQQALVEFLEQAGGVVRGYDRWPGWLTEYIGPSWQEAIERAKSAGLVRVDLVLTK